MDNSNVLTGGYSNYFHVFSRDGKTDIPLHADKSAFKKRQGSAKTKGPSLMRRGKDKDTPMGPNADNIDFDKKILHAAWHPQENSIAVAATNNLFIFSQT